MCVSVFSSSLRVSRIAAARSREKLFLSMLEDVGWRSLRLLKIQSFRVFFFNLFIEFFRLWQCRNRPLISSE